MWLPTHWGVHCGELLKMIVRHPISEIHKDSRSDFYNCKTVKCFLKSLSRDIVTFFKVEKEILLQNTKTAEKTQFMRLEGVTEPSARSAYLR